MGAWRVLNCVRKVVGKNLEWLRITKNKFADGYDFQGGQATLAEFLEGWLVSSRSSRFPETIDI